jgi:hypothetical protein
VLDSREGARSEIEYAEVLVAIVEEVIDEGRGSRAHVENRGGSIWSAGADPFNRAGWNVLIPAHFFNGLLGINVLPVCLCAHATNVGAA